jgi:hypothetical protein
MREGTVAVADVEYASDVAEDIAEGFDDLREELSPGVRLFLFAMDPVDENRYHPISIGTDPNGEVLGGFLPKSGWLPDTSTENIPLAVKVVESSLYTRDILGRVGAGGALGLMLAGESKATLYRVQVVGVPVVGIKPVWKFTGARTRMSYTPV